MCRLKMLLFAFTLVAFGGLGAAVTVDNCPLNLIRDQYLQVFGDLCYQFYPSHRHDYDDAELICESLGGSLALVKTLDVQNFLLDQILHTYQYADTHDWWIGLHDKIDEGTFVWEDGTGLGTYSNWGDNEGANHHGILLGLLSTAGSEDCVGLNPNNGGMWEDLPCDSETNGLLFSSIDHDLENPYVCQFKASVVVSTTTMATTTTAPATSTTNPTVPTTSTTIVIPLALSSRTSTSVTTTTSVPPTSTTTQGTPATSTTNPTVPTTSTTIVIPLALSSRTTTSVTTTTSVPPTSTTTQGTTPPTTGFSTTTGPVPASTTLTSLPSSTTIIPFSAASSSQTATSFTTPTSSPFPLTSSAYPPRTTT